MQDNRQTSVLPCTTRLLSSRSQSLVSRDRAIVASRFPHGTGFCRPHRFNWTPIPSIQLSLIEARTAMETTARPDQVADWRDPGVP